MNTKIVSDNIRAERNRSKITIDIIVKELDISKPTYIEYEKDAVNVRVDTLIKLSKLFKCKVSDFFYIKN